MLRSPSGRPTISAAPTPTWNGCSAEPSSMPAGSHPSRGRPWGSSQTPPTKPRKTPPTRARTNHPERQWRRHEGHQLARHRRRYRSSLRATDLPAFPRRPRRRHRRRHHLPAVRLLGLRQPNPNDRTANVLGNDHLRQTTRTPRNRLLTARESNHPTRNPFMYWHSRRATEHSRTPDARICARCYSIVRPDQSLKPSSPASTPTCRATKATASSPNSPRPRGNQLRPVLDKLIGIQRTRHGPT